MRPQRCRTICLFSASAVASHSLPPSPARPSAGGPCETRYAPLLLLPNRRSLRGPHRRLRIRHRAGCGPPAHRTPRTQSPSNAAWSSSPMPIELYWADRCTCSHYLHSSEFVIENIKGPTGPVNHRGCPFVQCRLPTAMPIDRRSPQWARATSSASSPNADAP